MAIKINIPAMAEMKAGIGIMDKICKDRLPSRLLNNWITPEGDSIGRCSTQGPAILKIAQGKSAEDATRLGIDAEIGLRLF